MVRPLNLKWGCANGLRADRFDDEIAKALFSSGCDFISFGIESSDNDVLKTIKKGETVHQIERAINIAKKYFSKVNGYFIIGLPGSSYDKDLSSLRWALKNNINAHFSYYVPFDKQMHYDTIFYGNNAKPVSSEYPGILQKKIFDLTACMRADYQKSFLKQIFSKLLLRLRFAPASIPEFLRSELGSHIHA
jgi:radical SAM superfamily enzyme YgiQ (UPF0313 family)